MSETFSSIPRGTKVLFQYHGKVREGVVREGFSRTANSLSPTTAYCVIYRHGEYTVNADDVLVVD